MPRSTTAGTAVAGEPVVADRPYPSGAHPAQSHPRGGQLRRRTSRAVDARWRGRSRRGDLVVPLGDHGIQAPPGRALAELSELRPTAAAAARSEEHTSE